MTSIDDVMIEITPQVLLKAYACGIFPMAESAEDNALYWIEPERRGILPLDRVHVPRRLARTIRHGGFEVRVELEKEDGEFLSAQVTRETADRLGLETGRRIFVRPTNERVFTADGAGI